MIDFEWDIGRILLGVQTPEIVDEIVGHRSGILGRWGGEGGWRIGEGAGVVQGGGGGQVVNCDYRSVHECGGGHHVLAGALIGRHNHVGGLTWGDQDGVGFEGLDVGGVHFNYG